MSDEPSSPQHQEPEKPLVYEPPDLEGRQHVAKVASDFRIREDECLADKLQNEEFEYHFGQNRSERWRGKIDIKKAKEIYLQEVENSGLLSKDELNRLCSQDAALASDINSQINDKKEIDSHRKTALEMQDEEFARYLEDRERKKYEEERKRRIQRKMQEDKATVEKLKRESIKEARRDDEEAIASGVSKMKVKADHRYERNVEEDDDEYEERNPGRNWSVKCEAAPSPARDKAKQELKDKEIARALQIKEVELEKKRAEEERDRRLALKLQKAEAEEYQRQRREREMRRAQSERRPDDRRHHSGSSDDSSDRRHRSGSNPSRSQSEKIHHQRDHRVQADNNHRGAHRPSEPEEPIYLKAVDSPSRGKYVETENSSPRKRAEAPIDREKVLRQQEEIYRQAQASNVRSKSSQKHDDRDRQRSAANERRLVDDQMLLRQQVRDLSKSNNPQHTSNSNHKNHKQQRPRNTIDGDLDSRRPPVRPSGHAPRRTENLYDEPEKNNDIDYTNIARNIDPTYRNTPSEPDYQTIGPPKTFKGHQVGMLDTDNPIAHVPPVPVIQNVKRSSRHEEKKKSKKWFK